jgi:Flp pilus assembly protein TadD
LPTNLNVLYTNAFPISKATGLDGTFPPAWFGTGIAYAAQEEGDQAMAAFRTAARLFPGSVIPYFVCL